MGLPTLNRGIDWQRELREISDEDWKFGSIATRVFPEDTRHTYLPAGEVQRGKEDWMACASIAAVNIAATYFNWLHDSFSPENRRWLCRVGYRQDNSGTDFNDRFVAINSGTTRQGNSLKAPLDAIRKMGLIPKSLHPANKEMDWDAYHDPSIIDFKAKDLARQFLDRFSINYERISESDFPHALRSDMLDVALFAWPRPVNGVYPRVGYSPNHASVLLRGRYEDYDSYVDEVDGDYIKKLDHNYDFFGHGYRLIVSEKPIKKFWLVNIWNRLWK